MINVEFFGYRDWAKKIKRNLEDIPSDLWKITDRKPTHVSLYYGWSEMIPKEIYEDHLCLILHPSPLPKYRGGSPLQHQIINGEKVGAVTICQVTDKLDAGDIYSQTPISLEGSLDNIFKRIISTGTVDSMRVLSGIARGDIQPIVQDESQATTYSRRKPEESELTLLDLDTKTAEQLNNFIRALADPYPNAFIKTVDGKKLYLTGSHLDEPT